MRKRVAIVGSGPTALYALQELVDCPQPMTIVVFERAAIAGKGTPYQRGINDPTMLSNIASIEIPCLPETLVEWLFHQNAAYLEEFETTFESVSDRTFYPRVVLGDYFHAQFETIVKRGMDAKHDVIVAEECAVRDIVPSGRQFEIVLNGDTCADNLMFDFVIVATGHSFPTQPETSPGFFEAPWPATALHSIPCGSVGVLGTSLSAIDAVVTLASSFGTFDRNDKGELRYKLKEDCAGLNVVMMSRKGLLPEADFYFPIPYVQPMICTSQAVETRALLGSSGLLDDVFELFRRELIAADPSFSEQIDLKNLTVDTFAAAYYGLREKLHPFEWAARNLQEAKRNYALEHTVAWRYAILITHEIIESAVSRFTKGDLDRFNASFKSIFADEYATVPHLSIERVLALYRAHCIEIMPLGDAFEISRADTGRGAIVKCGETEVAFDTLINATGQRIHSVEDLPFPALAERGLIHEAMTLTNGGSRVRTGGIDVDRFCRPLVAGTRPVRNLYFPAMSYLLHKRPFVQGLTSAAELGQAVAKSIILEITRPVRSRRLRKSSSVQTVTLVTVEA